jgi:hypothetical protein
LAAETGKANRSIKASNRSAKAANLLETNPELKNAFFKEVFKSEERRRDLVKLFTGNSDEPMELMTVSPVIFGKKENDLGFLSGIIYYYMLEAQSTPNKNIPFRMAEYAVEGLASLLEKTDNLYGSKMVKVAVPMLYTVFVGCKKKAPAKVVGEQRLSDMYKAKMKHYDLEVVVHTYDFNMAYAEVVRYIDNGKLPRRLSKYKDTALLNYALFANGSKYLQMCGKDPELTKPKSVATVLELCKLFEKRGIFVDLFTRKEVCQMAVLDFSRDEMLKWAGKEEGIQALVEAFSEDGYSEDAIKNKLVRKFDLTEQDAKEYVEMYLPFCMTLRREGAF